MRKPSYKWEGVYPISLVFEIDAPSQGSARRKLGAAKRRVAQALKEVLARKGISCEVISIASGSWVQAYDFSKRRRRK